MFTWISKPLSGARGKGLRALGIGMLGFVLSGCLGEDGGALGFLSSGSEKEVAREVLRKVSLYDGEVIVRGPEGYCIDSKTVRRQSRGGFVLLASCESLSGLRGKEVAPVVMTVTVLPDTAGLQEPGPADVARSLPAAQVIKTHEAQGVALVQFATGGEGILPEGDPRHWRGAMTLNGHLLGLALYAPQGSAMAGDKGRDMLSNLARSIRRDSPVPGQ